MARTLAQFQVRMGQLGKRVERNVPAILRKVALAADQAVVLATPVDTGRARSNWIASVGSPSRDTNEAFVPGEKGSTGAANSAAAIAQATGAIKNVRREEQSIYISNNLPYIGRLNEGHSAQAPSGFIEQGVKAAAAKVAGVKVLPRDL